MALHRDIYWVGRQWAVTGHGVQACDQKQKGQFDIEGARLWDDSVLESMRALKWLNVADFDQALAVARKYFPEPPDKAAPPESAPYAPPESAPYIENVPAKEHALPVTDAAPVAPPPPPLPQPQPKPVLQKFHMRIDGASAKFSRQWRVRVLR